MYRQFLFTPDFHQYKFQLTDKVRKIIQRYEHRIKTCWWKPDKSINCHKHVSNVYGKSELNRTDTRTNYHQRHLCMVDIWRWQTLARYLMTSQSICVNHLVPTAESRAFTQIGPGDQVALLSDAEWLHRFTTLFRQRLILTCWCTRWIKQTNVSL